MRTRNAILMMMMTTTTPITIMWICLWSGASDEVACGKVAVPFRCVVVFQFQWK